MRNDLIEYDATAAAYRSDLMPVIKKNKPSLILSALLDTVYRETKCTALDESE